MAYFGKNSADDAQSICDENGATLPLPRNEQENLDYTLAFDLIRELYDYYSSDFSVVLGANDGTVEGEWRDVNGNELNYTNWGHDQPDDFSLWGSSGEDYATMPADYEDSSTWNDLDGNNQNQVICVFDEHNGNYISDESGKYAFVISKS